MTFLLRPTLHARTLIGLSSFMVVVALMAAPPIALATPDPNSQWWGELDLTHPLSPGVSITTSGYVRAGDEYPNPWLTGIGANVDYHVSAFTLTGGGLLVRVRTLSGQDLNVRLPYIAGSYSLRLGSFSISDRVRIEQLSGVPGTPRRYRDKFGIDLPLKDHLVTATDLVVSQEWFLNSAHELTRTRTTAALEFALSPGTSLQLQYIRQHSTTGFPRTLNILGTELGVMF